jgi:sulfide:quinone oxidoreductase
MPKRVVILGGGVGGTLVANLLARKLSKEDVELTVADLDGKHVYQPGWLYIPFGKEKAGILSNPSAVCSTSGSIL